jgi:Plasmid pRiA4b ORF-3-like protein
VGAAKKQEIYQFKVTLVDTNPQIWRRIHVAGDCTLAQLHRVLQVAMGWENYHLFMFRIGGKTYGPPDPDFDGGPKLIDAKRMRVRAALPGVGTTFGYVYDFGDNWQHDLLLEAIIMPVSDMTYPRCIAGERNCPPEDAGGTHGYRNYLEAMANPRHKEHRDMMMWRGRFNPEEFSVEKVNHELQRRFRRPRETVHLGSTTAPPRLSPKRNRMQPATLSTLVFPQRHRVPIRPNEAVPVELNQRERELILSHTFADKSLTDRLQLVPQPGQRPIFHFTLDVLDELAGSIAAEANHAKNRALQEQLDELCERIEAVLNKYAGTGV